MQDNEYAAPVSPLVPREGEAAAEPSAEQDGSPPGRPLSAWQGAKAGVRLVSYVIGPLAFALLVPGFAITAFGVGSGRGWGLGLLVVNPVKLYLVCTAFSGGIGAVIAFLASLVPRARPGSHTVAWWARLWRPIGRPAMGQSPESRPAARPRLWRLVSWLFWGTLAFTASTEVAAFLAGVYAGRVVDRRLAEAVAAADADDPNWRFDDLLAAREPVPDEENAANVVAEVLELLPGSWPYPDKTVSGGAAPAPTELESAYDRVAPTPENIRLDDATADTLRHELRTQEAAVRRARAVADYARGRHELIPGPTLIDTPLTETQSARIVARLMCADAAVRAHDGDTDGALDSCRAVLGVARSIGDEPFLIGQLVRIAIGVTATRSARRVLGQGEPSDAALARLQNDLLAEMSQPLLLYGVKGERAVSTGIIHRVGTGEIPIEALSDKGPKSDRVLVAQPVGAWHLWMDYQEAVAIDWMNGAVAIARHPAPERPPLFRAWDDRRQRVRRSTISMGFAVLPMLLIPAVESASVGHARYEADLGATALLVAAERHRRNTGAWPKTIEAIDPLILPESPVDPFTGRPFRMEHREGLIVVYSVGPDLRDDQGSFDSKRWREGGPDDVAATAWDVPGRRRTPGR